MIYVYAITDGLALDFPNQTGMEDHPTEFKACDGIGVVMSRHSHGRFDPVGGNVLAHERVVESLMHEGAVLPARFGTAFHNEQDLNSVITSKADALRCGLDKVRGCVEMGVRVLAEARAVASAAQAATASSRMESGRAWMLARLERERQAARIRQVDQSIALSLHEPLVALARDSRLKMRASERFLMTAAYLVLRDGIDEFTGAVRKVAAERPEVRVLCTGPWPAYNFAPALGDGEGGRG